MQNFCLSVLIVANMFLCIKEFVLILSFFFGLLSITEGKRDEEKLHRKNSPQCSNIQIAASENSGKVFHLIKGIEWVNCTFDIDSKIKSSGALVVIRIFAIELHTADWSEIIMPGGDHIPHNVTTPIYREGELPWCGIYLKKESSRIRAANEGLCPGSIYKAKTWPPKLTINAKSLRLSLWYAFLDCRNKAARPVDVDVIDNSLLPNDDPFLTSPTGPPAPELPSPEPTTIINTTTTQSKPTKCTEASTGQYNITDATESLRNYEQEFYIALAGIGVLFLVIVIIVVILITMCIKNRITPVIVTKPEQPHSPTYRQYDQVSTLPKRSSNHSFRPPPPAPEDPAETSNYQYIDLPVFAHSPTFSPDFSQTSVNETFSDCGTDKPIMSTSSELVANELYHLPKC